MPQMTFRLLSYLFLLAVAIQFFLAGLGVLGGESLEAHRQWGFIVMHLIPLLMFGVAIWGKMGKVTIMMVVTLFVLVALQPAFASESLSPMWLRSLHVLNALFIFALGFHITQRAGGMHTRNQEA